MSDGGKPSFWNTLPGLITAIAALLTAAGGVVTVCRSNKVTEPSAAIPAKKQSQSSLSDVTERISPMIREQKALTDGSVAAKTAANPAKSGLGDVLQEGTFELYRLNGAPQKRGIILRLRRVSEVLFLADCTTPTEYSWYGEFRRKGDKWDLAIIGRQGHNIPQPGTAFNPESTSNEIVREGPLLTIQSQTGTFIWKQQDK